MDSIAYLRQQLCLPPNRILLQQLLEWIEGLEDEQDRDTARSYLAGHLKDWPEHACQLPSWLLQEHPDAAALLPPFPETPEECLERCLQACQSQQLEAAFDWAWSAWRRHRHPDIAGLLEELDDALPQLVLAGKKQPQQEQWMELAMSCDVRKLGKLWSLAIEPRSSKHCLERLSALTAWCDDPRSTRALLQILRHPPWTADSSRTFWRSLFARMAEVRDCRLEAARSFTWDIRPLMDTYMHTQVCQVLDGLDLQTPPPCSERSQQLLAQIEPLVAGLRSSPEDALEAAWSAVYADLDDLEARRALSQQLQEQGHPRGEFIALQLEAPPTPEQRARARALHREHREDWLQELAPYALKGDTYRRGLLHHLKLRKKIRGPLQSYLQHPLWRSVQKLECYYPEYPEICAIPGLQRLTHLHLNIAEPPREDFAIQPGQSSAFCDSLEFLSLRCTCWRTSLSQLMVAWEQAARCFPRLGELRVTKGESRLVFRSDADGQLSRLEVLGLAPERDTELAFWSLPQDALTQVEFSPHLRNAGWLLGALPRQRRCLQWKGLSETPSILPEALLERSQAFEPLRQEGWQGLLKGWYADAPFLHQHHPCASLSACLELELDVPMNSSSQCRALSEDLRHLCHAYEFTTQLELWDRSQATRIARLRLPSQRRASFFFRGTGELWYHSEHKDPTCLAFSGFGLETLTHLRREALIVRREKGEECGGLQVHPQSGELWLALGPKLLQLDPDTGECIHLHSFDAPLDQLHLSLCGGYLALAPVQLEHTDPDFDEYAPPQLWLWDIQAQSICHTLRGSARCGMLFHPDLRRFFYGFAGQVWVLDLAQGERRLWHQNDTGQDFFLLLSADGQQLGLGYRHAGIDVVDVASGLKWQALGLRESQRLPAGSGLT